MAVPFVQHIEVPGQRDVFRVNLGRAQLRIIRVSDMAGIRYVVVVAGRRLGKTTAAAARMARKAVNKKNAVIWYIAPTYRQAKDIMWEQLKALFPKAYLRGKPNETELSIRLINGSVLALKGADNPDSLRGPGLDDATFDEYADQKPKVWDVVRPMLADKSRQGTGLWLGTPRGFDHFYDLHQKGVDGIAQPGWASLRFTTLEGGRVSPEEIEAARNELDIRVFRQEFEASFEELFGRVYYAYSDDPWPNGNRDQHLLDRGGTLYVGMDFNVHPMTAVIFQKHFQQAHALDEIHLPSSDTTEMAAEINARYPDRHIVICPDASGGARSTKAVMGTTDLTILRDAGFEVLHDRANPRIVDRYNNCNSNFLTASGVRRTRVHPRCKHYRKGLLGFTYKEGTSQPDLRSPHTHITDAAGYALWQVFNVFDRVQRLVAPDAGEIANPYTSVE